MEEQQVTFIFDQSRSIGVVLYDLASAGTSDPPLWNAPGERYSWSLTVSPTVSAPEWISEREHEVEIATLIDSPVLLHVQTSERPLAPPEGHWDVQLWTRLTCPSGSLGVRYISGKAQAVINVSTQRLKICACGRYIDTNDDEYLQEYFLQIWPDG